MGRDLDQKRISLTDLARQQGGYFTAAQAVAIGFDNANQFRFAADGRWERVRRGIFRLASEPLSSDADLHITSLFFRRRDGSHGGIFGLETAARIHGLGNFMPDSIQVLIEGRLRKRAELPPGVEVIRTYDISTEVETIDGLLVTSPIRTIADLLGALDRDEEEVRRAFVAGRQAGIISNDKIAKMDQCLPAEVVAIIRNWKVGSSRIKYR